MTTPAEQGEELDYLVLGTARSPGTLTLSGHDRWKNWDVQAAKGTTGASSNLNGDPIGQFEATFHLAEFDGDGVPTGDFENWTAFRKLIESLTQGPTPIALPIYHPDLAENGFTEVSSGGIGAAVHDGTGGKSYTVRFLEYRPPKAKPSGKAKAKPAGGTVAGKPPPPLDPNWRAKAELAELLATAIDPWGARRS
jgi:hypothetical protein